jgi:hypothetical protein
MAANDKVKAWGIVVLLAGAFEVSAITVTVKKAAAIETPAAVAASVRRVDGDMPIRDLQLAVGAATSVDVGDVGTWEITAKSNAYWAAPVYASGAQAVTLELYPRGTIAGTLGARTPPSGQLIVKFAPADESVQEPAGTAVCPFDDRQWNCALPSAGKFDLRFSLTGFATEFRWGVNVDAETPVHLGVLDFTPGSSVSGNIQWRGRAAHDVLKNAIVSLTPTNLDPARMKVRQYTAAPDARGFFQVRGLSPGEYTIVAQAGQWISDSRTMQVIANTNASLKHPLLLAQPRRVSVKISPPLDVEQQRWQVTLIRFFREEHRGDYVDRSLASATGTWSQNSLIPGDYELVIEQQDGGRWRAEDFTIAAEDGDRSFDLTLSSQRVGGRVTLGDKPVAAAKIYFGDENGPRVVADQQGRFQAAIPPVQGDDETVALLIVSDTPDISRTVHLKGERSSDGELYFDVVLPSASIIGRSINEDGSPHPNALVDMHFKGDDRFFEQMWTQADGSFQFFGFEPGVYRIQADGGQKSSGEIEIEVPREGVTSIDLVMRAQEEVRGRVVMNGVPVAGATVYAWPRGVPWTFLPEVKTDSQGRFVLKLPPGTNTYDAIVFPRGFFVTAARIERDPKVNLRVDVGQNGGTLTVESPADDDALWLHRDGGEYRLDWVARTAGGVDTTENGRQRFTIPSLESGQYSVCGRKGCKSVYVPQFAAASVKFD